ncbi:MAG: YbhB/YbcL family Raf kinase inhibitor-like protein [Chloroflexota bacterium]
MKLTIPSFERNGKIPGEFALCVPAVEGHVAFAANRSPHLTWEDAPEGTRSFAVICVDVDAPTRPDDVNQEGRTVPFDLPRANFYHWVLVDIPATQTELTAGLDSNGVTEGGKPAGPVAYGVRGINDYTSWFSGHEVMHGIYGGYDGPCPPWNDERVHRYYFRLYALDLATLGMSGDFTAADALKKMHGHILAEDEWMGTCALYENAKLP